MWNAFLINSRFNQILFAGSNRRLLNRFDGDCRAPGGSPVDSQPLFPPD